MENLTIVALCPICKVTRNCAPDGCLKCHLSGRVVAGELEAAIKAGTVLTPTAHDCEAEPVQYRSDGALGHGFECGICGAFLQAG